VSSTHIHFVFLAPQKPVFDLRFLYTSAKPINKQHYSISHSAQTRKFRTTTDFQPSTMSAQTLTPTAASNVGAGLGLAGLTADSAHLSRATLIIVIIIVGISVLSFSVALYYLFRWTCGSRARRHAGRQPLDDRNVFTSFVPKTTDFIPGVSRTSNNRDVEMGPREALMSGGAGGYSNSDESGSRIERPVQAAAGHGREEPAWPLLTTESECEAYQGGWRQAVYFA